MYMYITFIIFQVRLDAQIVTFSVLYPRKQGNKLRRLMTFAWPCLLSKNCVDPATKYHGHLLLSHIIAKFAIHKRIVLQVTRATTANKCLFFTMYLIIWCKSHIITEFAIHKCILLSVLRVAFAEK